MDCDSIRIAVSAAQDGEDPGVPADVVREHLDGCTECRAWQERQHVLTRQVRLGGPALDHDLVPAVLAALPAEPEYGRRARWSRRRRDRVGGGTVRTSELRQRPGWISAALVLVALAQLAITVPLLVMGRDHDASAHAAHELGSFDLALAIAFVVGAVRPRLSAGLAWPCVIAAGGLAVTAIAGIIEGQTPGADEAQHLVAVIGALLLAWQARGGARAEQPGTAASPASPDSADLPWQWQQADGVPPAKGRSHPGTPVAAGPDYAEPDNEKVAG
jgi:predicted anti-sigma-YlaC factor YlaD